MVNIAVTGKGGVGKTTIVGILSRLLSRDGYNVLAVDADPDMNLGSALGVDTSGVEPLSSKQELIAERAGGQTGQGMGGMFKLNPKVDDIADKYGIEAPDGVNLILMGTVEKGGTGCMCPADAFLRALLRHLIIRRGDAVVLDMEAGVEHLGRGTAKSVDSLLIVVEPGMKSLKTAERIKNLASDLEISKLEAIVNKARSEKDTELVQKKLNDLNIPIIGTIPYDENFMEADLSEKSPLDFKENSEGIESIKEIKKKITNRTE